MRTNIDINDSLIAQAMQLTGLRTKREAVERGLQQLIHSAQRPTLRSMFGSGGIADDYDYATLRVQPSYLTQPEQHKTHPEPAAHTEANPASVIRKRQGAMLKNAAPRNTRGERNAAA